jgi:GT2 family glycosyltransferase
MAVALLRGEPLGAASLSVDDAGHVSRERLAQAVRRQLGAELRTVLARRGLSLPRSLPLSGVPTESDGGANGGQRRRSVSVVVTTCRDTGALERCLESVLASEYDEFEVIVVENRPGSSDTLRMLGERFPADPRLRYVDESARGLSRARNAGLALAEGELVAFTDDDVIVDPAWIQRSVKAFDRARDIGCVTGLILPIELETDAQVLLEQFARFGKGFRRRTYRLAWAGGGESPYLFTPGAIGSGANTVLRTDLARQLGGFDTRLGAGTPAACGEDLDVYIRVLRAGRAVVYDPSAIVWHGHPDGGAPVRRHVYRYGVGLGAMLAKQLVTGPDRRELLRAVPAGVRYALKPAAGKNAGKTGHYPPRLDRRERVGMLMGPAAYLMSRFVTTIRRRPTNARPAAVAGGASYVERLVLSGGKTIEVASFADVASPPGPRARHTTRHIKHRTRVGGGLTSPARRGLSAVAASACVLTPLSLALGLPAALTLSAGLVLLLALAATYVPAVIARLHPPRTYGGERATMAATWQSAIDHGATMIAALVGWARRQLGRTRAHFR